MAAGVSPDWLASDAVAALSVWALLVPQALGYATLAGVPVQYGLYAAVTGLVAYAIFGTSRQVVGPELGDGCGVRGGGRTQEQAAPTERPAG